MFILVIYMSADFVLQAQEMGASGTMIGLIFGIYPLVVFLVAPVLGVFVSELCVHFSLVNHYTVYTVSDLIITITKLSNLIGYQLP